MKSRETSRSKIGPFSLACTDPYKSLNEGIFFRSGLSYSDHSMRVFVSERVELLRSLNEGIFFRSGLSYKDHSMRVFFRSGLSYSMRVFFRSGLSY